MQWHEVGYIILVFFAAVTAAILAAYSWHHRDNKGAVPFAGFMLAVAGWCVTSGIYILSASEETALFWSNIGLIAVAYAPVTFLIFALQYTGRERWLTRRRILLLYVMPCTTQLLLWTNPLHRLFYVNIHFIRHGAFMIWDITPGAGFFLHLIYSYLLVVIAFFMLGRMIVHSFRLYRIQAMLQIIGLSLPAIVAVIDAFTLLPGVPELAPIGFSAMGLIYAWALFRHHLLDVVPVARDTLIDSMTDGMAVLDTQHRIVDMNPAMERFIGISSTQVIGQPAANILHFWAEFAGHLSGDAHFQTEISLHNQDQTHHYDLRVEPLRNRQGRLTGAFIILRDITDRKRVEQALLKLQKAIETTEIGITITNAKGEIEYTNPADARMHGYTVEELRGRSASLFAPPKKRKDASLSPREADPLFNWKRQRTNVRKDGALFPVELISNPIYDERGNVIGRVTVCEDITERQRAEAELMEAHRALTEKNEQLQALNASKDKFFSIISHDLKSPFNTLLGFARLLSDNIEHYSLEKQKQFADNLLDSAERLYALLENLLTWSRLQRGRMEYHPQRFLLGETVADVVAVFSPKAREKQVALTCSIPAALQMIADPGMVYTIMRNLVSNALKFTHAGDVVAISARKREQAIDLIVSDSGVGIRAEDLPKLFRIDVQYTHPGTAGERGTGLGLILCQELAELNGGSIRVESEVGKGTTFYVTLPHTA